MTETVEPRTIVRQLTFDGDADLVWDRVSDFGGTRYPASPGGPAVTLTGDPATPGTERRAALDNGTLIRERLVLIDDARRVLAYSLVEPPFPITDHRATVTVTDEHHRVSVEYRAEFQATAAVAEALEPVMGGAFEQLLDRYAGKDAAG
ncbi:SRPBCC family protein [Nocardioides sp.]|uniref:SRPBCC family protein n=1 Tax=Nocardioides sp. TaxID=35761 RepID=UPI0039E5FD5B